jgi:hypothetical protein
VGAGLVIALEGPFSAMLDIPRGFESVDANGAANCAITRASGCLNVAGQWSVRLGFTGIFQTTEASAMKMHHVAGLELVDKFSSHSVFS